MVIIDEFTVWKKLKSSVGKSEETLNLVGKNNEI